MYQKKSSTRCRRDGRSTTGCLAGAHEGLLGSGEAFCSIRAPLGVLGLLILAAGAGLACAEEAGKGKSPAAADTAFYEQRVRPLLSARCYKCHGPETQEANLRLDTYEGLTEGGASGELFSVERPDESLLLVAVSYKNEDLQMPPDAKLSDAQIADIREWIARGVPHPDRPAEVAPKPQQPEFTAAAWEFWAFQTPVASRLPAVNNVAWCRTPVDHFILAELESRGLAPMEEADKRTLIRRITLDLIGIPPTTDEVQAFLEDTSPEAYERVVDRLLGSPRYGERWGRHWLDVARYADSNGLDENVAHGNAWRYRDYVVDAWNADKPFDQFAREQIAGDLLSSESEMERRERLIATGFLSLGAKVLAEVDERKMEMDIVDEQIDTLGRTFLGLTLGCARCHDHKFDPIRTEDYYALAGVLRSTKTMETFTKVARWYEHPIPTPAELQAKAAHEQKVAQQKAAIESVIEAAKKAQQASLGAGATLPAKPESMFPEETRAELKRLRDELARLEKAAPVVSSAMGVSEGAVADTAVCIRGSHLTPGATVPRGVPLILAGSTASFPAKESGRTQLADWLVAPDHPLTARVIVNRVWRWHFGRGIVESTDNFGKLGERPSHPALLDWLAVWFQREGWSLKQLHRLIVRSTTYRQASVGTAEPGIVQRTRLPAHRAADAQSGWKAAVEKGNAIDPDNRLLWRFPVRRLEAEVLRDALLAVSGRLDTAMGGSLLHVGNRQYLFDHTSQDGTRYDSRRRAVYLPVIRNNLYEVFQLFDATDATVPSGDRASSTVATQALFLMNSPLILECAESLAVGTLAAPGGDEERIDRLHRRVFVRPAAAAEVACALEFVRTFTSIPASGSDEQAACREAWTALCQAMLASNEFLYVR